MISQRKEKNKERIEKYAFSYVFWRRGITIYPPYKNFVLEISIRREEGARDARDTRSVHEEVHGDMHKEKHKTCTRFKGFTILGLEQLGVSLTNDVFSFPSSFSRSVSVPRHKYQWDLFVLQSLRTFAQYLCRLLCVSQIWP